MHQISRAREIREASNQLDGFSGNQAGDDGVGGCNGVDDVARHALRRRTACRHHLHSRHGRNV